MKNSAPRLIFSALLACTALASEASSTPAHLYTLNGSFSDALGGPALVGNGGTLGANSYSFGANQGLSVDQALSNGAVYTIDYSFTLANTSGYRRLLDFKAGSTDTGLYDLSTSLKFYNVAGGSGAGNSFADGQQVRLTVTRDAAGQFEGYINGVKQISFADSGNLAVFSTNQRTARFFIDDGGEASAGSVDYIAIYSQVLSGAEIANLTPAVPEPQSYALLLAGLAGLGLMRQSAKQRRPS